MLNGISGLITQQDLFERAVYLELPTISGRERVTDQQLQKAFETYWPGILGAILDLFATTLAKLTELDHAGLPRMADFALLGRAVSLTMGEPAEAYNEAYKQNRLDAVERGLEDSPIYQPLISLLNNTPGGFYGTYQDLLEKLTFHSDTRCRDWPHNPKRLSNKLMRQTLALRLMGIHVDRDQQRRERGYYIPITRERVSGCT